ncbi:hypothetical protein AAL09_12100 [Salmonella enterica subsp. enterica serovar Newport]|nr:hypothetical protein [Salmonella enterica subsp. enterica serovar Enteritidis]EBX7470076.1 hypothetical protein [Salmonella enterica subsp. enterica serovar Bareilly]ECO0809172.1 hypothetical protein [Salmonella enterica subsp. enterica serovar Newport]EDU8207190.1 hypothetical protein [Salmonella enterica subsp. diarizonae]EDW1489045.1 hypothetical protein [Salmonella enterica subsp. enterica serovar Hvittingfoss]HCM8927934.1 hypothetical protein [Salmonella enterica subsp. enterica serova
MSEQNTRLIIVHQIARVEFSDLVSDFWNITDRNKVVTAPELMEPGGQYIERIAPEDNRPGAYKPDLLVTRSPEGEMIFRRLSDEASVTAD